MRGGRSFASRGGHSDNRDYGGKFRGTGNSYRDGGRFNNQNRGGNDRGGRFDDSFGKGGSSSRSRSRYDRRSSDRFMHDRSSRVNYFVNRFKNRLYVCKICKVYAHCVWKQFVVNII